MFQVRHIYEHNFGVVDDDSVAQAPEPASWHGRKYPLSRDEVREFHGSLEEAYDTVLRLLTACGVRPRSAP